MIRHKNIQKKQTDQEVKDSIKSTGTHLSSKSSYPKAFF